MVRTFSVVVALIAACTLAGCGGTTDAGPPPSPSASPIASSPSPTAPALPDAARANTKAGAVAFVRHYVDLINHAQATGDVGALAAVEDNRCSSCRSVRRNLKALYESGGSIDAGEWRVAGEPHIVPDPDIKGFTVEVAIRTTDQTVHDGRGHIKHVDGGTNVLTFLMSHRQATWKVAQWSRAL